MRNLRLFLILNMVLVTTAVTGLAESKCQPEFDKIKSLAGNWQGKATDGKPVHISYKLVSGGTAVMESIEAGTEPGMVTMYYLDGDQLVMTHFCDANNQPRMRADSSSSTPQAIKFEFVDVTNLSSPEAGHMHAHTILWKDADHVTQQWTWKQNGLQRVESFELERQK